MSIKDPNQLVLKSLNELFQHRFFIPSYQRGYRWTEEEVTRLLEDILQFCKRKKETGEFYCLQPIVVKAKNGNHDNDDCKIKEYEVIDGQQRLTTLFLILKKLEPVVELLYNHLLPLIPPKYETRGGSSNFLEKINEKSEEDAIENIDFYHMWKAYDVINKWFAKDTNKNITQKYIGALLSPTEDDQDDGEDEEGGNNVRVIWYEVDEDDSNNTIDVFTRLNIGKIPLTNSELIRALFLQKSNFGTANVDLMNIKQTGIASEWDAIEQELQNDSFWFFIYNKGNPIEYDNRIEYIFDLMKKRTKEKEDKYYTFNRFSEMIPENNKDQKVIEDIWNEINDYFLTFEEWYENRKFYHYIGYMINFIDKGSNDAEYTQKIIETVTSLKDMMKTVSKNKFIAYLEEKIKEMVVLNYDLEELEYKKGTLVRKILLLFNIETILTSLKSDVRFPFDKYKLNNWDIEHICPSNTPTEETFQTPEKKKAWLNDIFIYFTGKDINMLYSADDIEKEKAELANIVAQLDDTIKNKICVDTTKLYEKIEKNSKDITIKDDFEALFKFIQNHFEEDKIEEDTKNKIHNLTLLDSSTNRSYGNAFFPIKRKKIIDNDRKGLFIPITTKNVFLKYYSLKQSENLYWATSDAEDYLNAMKMTLKEFI